MAFDYVIIGGGSAGATLAARLSEDPKISVCLLEAGGESHKNVGINVPAMLPLAINSKKTNWMFETTPQPVLNGRRGYQPRGKTLGGSSAINGMIYIRGHRKDYDNWAEMGCEGWSYEDVLPYFKKSENNVRGTSEHHGDNGSLHVSDTPYTTQIADDFQKSCEAHQIRHIPDFNTGDNSGVGQYQVTQFHSKTDSNYGSGRRSSTAEAFLQPIRDTRKNLNIIANAHVAKIEFDGKRAKGVKYIQGKVGNFVSARKEVILCAGAFGSPQVLILSGIGNGDELSSLGIDVVHDNPNLGLNLHDHIDFLHGYKVKDKSTFGLAPGALTRAVSSIGEYRKNGTGF